MSDQDHGMSSAQLHASGALGNSGSGQNIASGSDGKMLPFEGHSFDSILPTGNMDSAFKIDGPDELLQALRSNAAFSQGPSKIGEIVNHLGTSEAKGDNLKIEEMGSGERPKAPTNIQGDLQMGKIGMLGAGPQQ
jgi:hypothetical protein